MAEIRIRRGLAEQAATNNPVLADGEPGWEQDTRIFKIGDGITPWVELEQVGGGAGGGSLPGGTTITVEYNGTTWPARPAGGTAIRVHWVGGTPSTPPPGGLTGHDLWSVPME